MFIWIAALASNVIAWFATVFTKKAALGTAAVSGGVALMLSLSAAINLLLAGMVQQAPPIIQAGAQMLPWNAGLCVSAVMTALGYKWAYNFAQKSIDRVLQA